MTDPHYTPIDITRLYISGCPRITLIGLMAVSGLQLEELSLPCNAEFKVGCDALAHFRALKKELQEAQEEQAQQAEEGEAADVAHDSSTPRSRSPTRSRKRRRLQVGKQGAKQGGCNKELNSDSLPRAPIMPAVNLPQLTQLELRANIKKKRRMRIVEESDSDEGG